MFELAALGFRLVEIRAGDSNVVSQTFREELVAEIGGAAIGLPASSLAMAAVRSKGA